VSEKKSGELGELRELRELEDKRELIIFGYLARKSHPKFRSLRVGCRVWRVGEELNQKMICDNAIWCSRMYLLQLSCQA